MLRDKLSPGTKPGFLKSEKMLRFKLLYIHKSVLENVYVNNIVNYGWCYSITLTYNVLGWCYCQYLHWDSLHPISSKYRVVGTLQYRAKTICSNKQLLKEEEEHLTKALMNCNYPRWALNRVRMKINNIAHKNKNKSRTTQLNNTPRPHITVPYYRGLSESIKQRCKNYGVQVYFRGGKTIKNLLMAPKDLDPMMKKSGVIYSYKCGRVECDEEYIGESSRTFGERFKEHQKAPLSHIWPF